MHVVEPISFLAIGLLSGGLVMWPLILRCTEQLAARRLEAALSSVKKRSIRNFDTSAEELRDELPSERVGEKDDHRLKIEACLPTIDFGASHEIASDAPPNGPMFLPLDAIQRNEMNKNTAQVPRRPPTQPFALSSTTIH